MPADPVKSMTQHGEKAYAVRSLLLFLFAAGAALLFVVSIFRKKLVRDRDVARPLRAPTLEIRIGAAGEFQIESVRIFHKYVSCSLVPLNEVGLGIPSGALYSFSSEATA